MNYSEFLRNKAIIDQPTGLTEIPALNPMLFNFQADITKWALRRGRAAVFAGCGCGKSFIQVEWARVISELVGVNVLILAPLAVAQQTVREAAKFGIAVKYCRHQSEVGDSRIVITNYEMLEHFDPSAFGAIVLDESSILKSYSGVIRNQIIETFQQTPYRLACTATPAPNDYMELGNHAEFLGVMSRSEMLSMFFIHDGGDTAKWRLKGHAEQDFWKWLASWAVMLRMPSDLGYDDGAFNLPPIEFHNHIVDVDRAESNSDTLFRMPAITLMERRTERRASTDARVKIAADLINSSKEQWLVWCDMNKESEALYNSINGAIEVQGSHLPEYKIQAALGFIDGTYRVLVSKPSIFGFGMNLQNCHNAAFVGLSDSYERFYQAVRRCWRFGQTKPVNIHIITAETEGAVLENIQRKEKDAERMASEMVKHMHLINEQNIRGLARETTAYNPREPMRLPDWIAA